MRAVVYARQGVPADVLQVAEVDTPGEPGPCEVLVRVLLRPIHYDDLLKVSGRCQPGAAGAAGVGLGLEGYGIVEQAGECVHLRPGVRVAFFPGQGTWSESALVPAGDITVIPDAVTDETAAQLHVNPLVAAHLVRAVKSSGAKAGQHVVVLTAAGSCVARLTIDVLLERGYDVIGVVRREMGVNALNVVFPDLPVISTQTDGWQAKVIAAAAGRPIGVALDPVGGKTTGAMAGLLAERGSLVIYGNLSGQPVSVPGLLFPNRDIRVWGVNLGRRATLPPAARRVDVALALDLAVRKPELFPVEAVYDLVEVAKAAAHVEAAGKAGAVLISSR